MARSNSFPRGFFAESATIYDSPQNNPDPYLSDYQHFHMGHLINGWAQFWIQRGRGVEAFNLEAFLTSLQ